MREFYTVDSILFPGETNIFDSQTGQVIGYTAKGILGDTLIFDNKGNNIGFAVDSAMFPGEKNVFLDDNKNDGFGGF